MIRRMWRLWRLRSCLRRGSIRGLRVIAWMVELGFCVLIAMMAWMGWRFGRYCIIGWGTKMGKGEEWLAFLYK